MFLCRLCRTSQRHRALPAEACSPAPPAAPPNPRASPAARGWRPLRQRERPSGAAAWCPPAAPRRGPAPRRAPRPPRPPHRPPPRWCRRGRPAPHPKLLQSPQAPRQVATTIACFHLFAVPCCAIDGHGCRRPGQWLTCRQPTLTLLRSVTVPLPPLADQVKCYRV